MPDSHYHLLYPASGYPVGASQVVLVYADSNKDNVPALESPKGLAGVLRNFGSDGVDSTLRERLHREAGMEISEDALLFEVGADKGREFLKVLFWLALTGLFLVGLPIAVVVEDLRQKKKRAQQRQAAERELRAAS